MLIAYACASGAHYRISCNACPTPMDPETAEAMMLPPCNDVIHKRVRETLLSVHSACMSVMHCHSIPCHDHHTHVFVFTRSCVILLCICTAGGCDQ